jgi:hypothetical protein
MSVDAALEYPEAVRWLADATLNKGSHGGGVGARHLNGEGSFDFILRPYRLDQRKRRVHTSL